MSIELVKVSLIHHVVVVVQSGNLCAFLNSDDEVLHFLQTQTKMAAESAAGISALV